MQLFSGKRSDDSGSAIQLREALSSLEHEREKNGSLRNDIVKLQEELNQAKTEGEVNHQILKILKNSTQIFWISLIFYFQLGIQFLHFFLFFLCVCFAIYL